MKWVTRARPKTDRIACPWLIRRFIDPDAQILFVAADQVLDVVAAEGAHSFDTKGATYTHPKTPQGELCTLEVLIDDHHLGDDPALIRLAAIVHAADISGDLHTDPLGSGLLAIGPGRPARRGRRPAATAAWTVRLRRPLRLVPAAEHHQRSPG